MHHPSLPYPLAPLHNPGQLSLLIHRNAGGRTADNALQVAEGVFNFRSVAADGIFPNALVVPGTAHLEDVDGAGHFLPAPPRTAASKMVSVMV